MRKHRKTSAFARASLLAMLLASGLNAAPPVVKESELEDAPLAIKPVRERTEADRDRIAAAALYTHGRTLLQHDDLPSALRRFQRAWRYHPQPPALIKEIISLSAELGREDEAARYALIAANHDAADEPLLRRMGLYLSDQNEYRQAVLLYEKSLTLHRDPKPDLGVALLHLELGRLYFLLEEFQPAAKHLEFVSAALQNPASAGLTEEQAKLLSGKPDVTYTLLGEAFFQAGQLDAAQQAFDRLHAAAPDAALLDFNRARLHHARKNHAAALASLEKYLASGASSAGADAYDLYAKLLREQSANNAPSAQTKLVENLANWQKQQPKNPLIAIYLARQYREAKNFSSAAALLEHQRKTNPSAQALRELTRIYLDDDQSPPLLAVLGEVALGEAGFEILKDEIAALVAAPQSVEKLLALAKEKPMQRGEGEVFAAGLIALAAKRYDVADELLSQAAGLPKPGKSTVFMTWGRGLFLADEPARAAGVFRRAIAEKALPRNPAHIHYLLASSLEFAGQTDEAIAAADEAAKIQPAAPLYLSRKAWILYHAKRYQEAEHAYQDVLDRFDHEFRIPELRDEMREARIVLSHICVLQNRVPDAVEWLEQVLDEFPSDISAKNDLSFLWSDRGLHLERALAMAQAAVDAEPENEAYLDSLGWALFRLGRHAEAIPLLKKAVAVEEPDGVLFDHLGDALHHAGQTDEAAQAWRQALGLFRKQNDSEKIKAVEKKLQLEPRTP